MSDSMIVQQAPKFPELEGMTFDQLDAERARLLGGRNDFDELSEIELERYIAINQRLRLSVRTASKPKANGGARGVKTPEQPLGGLLGY